MTARLAPADQAPRTLDGTGVAALIAEWALAEAAGVVPRMGQAPAAPGLAGYLALGARSYDLELTVQIDDTTARVGGTVCDSARACASFRGEAGTDDVAAATATVVSQVRAHIGRAASAETVAVWARPPSADAYAVRILGRGAYSWYHEGAGDESIPRAVLIDPSMALGQWLLGRRALALDNAAVAVQALTSARERRPESVIFAADRAVALSAAGRDADAAWRHVDTLAPGDQRFAVARADSALRAGRTAEAQAIVEGLGPASYVDANVAALRVRIAEATSATDDVLDPLLATWQDAAASDPLPVRKRIRLRVRNSRYDDARTLLPALAARAPKDEVARSSLALAVAVGDLEAAEGFARDLGSTRLEERIRARRKLEAQPTRAPLEIAWAEDAPALVAFGVALLRGGDAQKALKWAGRALKVDKEAVEAHALRAAAYRKLGWKSAEVDAVRAVRRLDPENADAILAGLYRGNTAPGATGTGVQSQPRSP